LAVLRLIAGRIGWLDRDVAQVFVIMIRIASYWRSPPPELVTLRGTALRAA
jgi:hypothetical protein